MSDVVSPPAARLRQSRWTDARLVTGVVLVLLAVVLGASVVGAADRSVQVWALRRTLPTGTTVERDDLVARRVRLFGADRDRYVDVRRGDPSGRVLLRDVGAGELLAVAALGTREGAPATRIVGIPLSRAHALGGGIHRGDRIDVLATRKTAGGGFVTEAVARGVRVVDVAKPSGGFSTGRGDLVVMVEVDPGLVLRLAAAIQSAEIDLSLVVGGTNGTGDLGAEVVTAPSPRP